MLIRAAGFSAWQTNNAFRVRLLPAFEELDLALVLLRSCARVERAQVLTLPSFGIFLLRVEAILTRF